MDLLLPNGRTIEGVPDGTSKADVKAAAIRNGLATQADFDVADHTAPYESDIAQAEQANGIPSGLLSSLISKESSGDASARSKANAIGLTQVLPSTLVDMGYDEQQVANDPKLQIQAGAQYLSQMLKATNGDVGRALTAYHSGLGNLAKYESGEKQMGPESAGYATDPRFARFVGQQQQQQQQQPDEVARLAAATNQPLSEPTPGPSIADDVEQAGKGILQAGVNVANIPGSIVNTGLQAAGVAPENQVQTLQLPQNLRPTDPYAQMGAEIGPYLIPVPGVQAESIAQTAARGAEALIPRIAGIIERNVPQSIAENTVGALAQNASSGNQNGFGDDLAMGTGASLAVRGALPVVGRVAQATRAALGRETAAGADAGAGAAGAAGAADVPPAAGAEVPPTAGAEVPPTGPAAPQSAPGVPQGGTAEEEALRTAGLRAGANNADPALASSTEGLNIQPRAEVQQAAERLGMSDDLLPSHLSGNEQYQAVEQAIKSRPGSALAVQENAAIDKLANRAGQMIDEVADAPDALALSTRFNNEFEQRMGALNRRSDQLYKNVDNALPQSQRVEAPITARHVEQMAEDVGGWEKLSTPEKEVFKAVNPAPEKMANGDMVQGVLTYARLNRVRKDIGNALGKRQGVYKDEDEAVLRGLYARLSEDQKNILGDVGARRDFEVANRLVAMRKGMEDRMQKLRGKDLTGDATRKANLAVSGLARGDSAQFRRMFEGNGMQGKKGEKPLVQTRMHRQQLIAQAIGEQLSAGRRGTGFNPAGFADWYGNLSKNGSLSLIAKHMPADFMAQLKDLHTVASAIRQAKGKEITTGRLNDFTRRFDRVNKAAALVADNATKAGAMIGGVIGPIGAAAGVAAGGKIAQVAQRVGGAEASAAAEKLISSPGFQAEVRKLANAPTPAAAEAAAEVVNQRVKRLPQYRELIQSLPPAERVKLARLGLIGWANSFDDSTQG